MGLQTCLELSELLRSELSDESETRTVSVRKLTGGGGNSHDTSAVSRLLLPVQNSRFVFALPCLATGVALRPPAADGSFSEAGRSAAYTSKGRTKLPNTDGLV